MIDWGRHPIGGLAISIASVRGSRLVTISFLNTLKPKQIERAFNLWRSGTLDLDSNDKKERKRKAFGELNWGAKARTWSSVASKLEPDRWEQILTDAVPFISSSTGDEEYLDIEETGDNGAQMVDPRTQIDLD